MNNYISVIIPAYNSDKFLAEAIESVLCQTYPASEIIVVDDGSTDNTKDVCNRYPTIKYIYQENQGAAAARNTGVQSSTGNLLIFLDSDDCLLPEAVEIGVNCLNDHPEAGFAFGHFVFRVINPDGTYTEEDLFNLASQPQVADYGTLLARQHFVQCACAIFRRVAIESVGGFNSGFLTAVEDQNLILRIARELPIYYHQQSVSEYRYNGNNESRHAAKLLLESMRLCEVERRYIQQSQRTKYLAAYEQAKQYWCKLSIERLPYEIMHSIKAGDWISALGTLRLISYFDPKLNFVDPDSYKSSYQAVLSHLRKLPLYNSLSYWQDTLAGVSFFSMPTDRPRPAELSLQSRTQSFTVSQVLTSTLINLSQQANITLSTLLLAAFKTLLYRYTGTEEIILGVPTINLDQQNFVNAIVLRTDVSGEPSFQQLLERVKDVTISAQNHQRLPFELLVEDLQLSHDASYAPLFQIMFAFEEDISFQEVKLSHLTASPWVIAGNSTSFDLTLLVRQTNAGIEGQWIYSTDLFEAGTIERMVGHFQTLLESIVANPDQSIATLPILTEAERQQLLVEWNDTKAEYIQDKCIHQLIEAQVERTPDAVAVVFENQQLTYRELNQRANQLAHHLQLLGIGPESLVGICVERSLEMVVGLLGILKAGGAYVPIDPTYPDDRITYMVEDAQLPVLLIQQALQSQFSEKPIRLVSLDSNWETIAQQNNGNLTSSVVADNPAYVIYTSGSTGKPKGAINLHKGVVNRLLWMQDKYRLTSDDRVLQKTPFSFDVSVWEFFWPLLTGARLVVARPEGHKDPDYLVELIAKEQITTLHFVPSMLQVFLEARELKSCHSLKRVICSGEALPFDLQERFFEQLHCELHNLYGPTEAAIDVSYWQCQPGSQLQKVPIGRPVANTQLYILDSALHPVPIGVAGELHIGGIQLARGYHNRPELTAEKFIFHPELEARLYKTGDLCRYLSDGNIEYLERIDHQVKIRGFRIELGEIETALSQHRAVQQAVVIVREDETEDKRLVAYLSTAKAEFPSVSQLRQFLRQTLPEYMIPSTFVQLESFPLTSNGKLDRRALPKPNDSNSYHPVAASTTTQASAPISAAHPTPVEQELLSIWKQVLKLEWLDIHDDFFELGGHSILAVQILSRIREVMQIDLPLRQLFEAPTIAQMSTSITQSQLKHLTEAELEHLLAEL